MLSEWDFEAVVAIMQLLAIQCFWLLLSEQDFAKNELTPVFETNVGTFGKVNALSEIASLAELELEIRHANVVGVFRIRPVKEEDFVDVVALESQEILFRLEYLLQSRVFDVIDFDEILY